MKRIFTLLFAFSFLFGFSQIKQVNTKKELVGKLMSGGLKTMYLEKDNYKYTFYYKDANLQRSDDKWKTFSCASANDLNEFFKIIMKGFRELPKDAVHLETAEGHIFLKYRKLGNKSLVYFAFNTEPKIASFSSQFTEQQVRVLFNRVRK